MFEQISSLQNPRIKNIIRLQKASERKDQNLVTVEGLRELHYAIQGGYHIKQFYYCPDIIAGDIRDLLKDAKPEDKDIFEISKPVFEKIAYRDSTEGIYALVENRILSLNKIRLRKTPLVLVIEAVEKPGNLGAILRTADAAAVDVVIICDPQTDIFNPNVIRSSIGAVFVNQIVSCASSEAILWLKKHNIRTFAAALGGKSYYNEANFNVPSAIIMGTESTGLSPIWLDACDEQVLIPMMGKMDSLNVSTSTAIIVFEALRQRGFSKG